MRAAIIALALALALAGCTQAFDLEDTHVPGEHDAKCPPIGETPRFTRALTQVVPRNCESYNYAAARGLAVASCNRDSEYGVEIGRVDELLAPAPGIMPRAAGSSTAYISQDEQRIYFANVTGELPDPFSIDGYRRQPDNTWLIDPALQFRSGSSSFPLRLSAIAAADGHDRTVLVDGANVVEIVIDPGWTPVRTTPATDLGVDAVSGFSMTADGLRAIFYGIVKTPTGQTSVAMYYTDRQSVDDAFRRGDPLDVSSYPGAFMSDDCGRIYMSGVGSIFYARQAR